MKNERLPGFRAENSLHKSNGYHSSYYYPVGEQSTITQQVENPDYFCSMGACLCNGFLDCLHMWKDGNAQNCACDDKGTCICKPGTTTTS
jgi:hypothetical protein